MTPWRECKDLMARLTETQNHPCFEHQDILTWAALCESRDELLRHVEACERRAANYVAPRRRTRKAA